MKAIDKGIAGKPGLVHTPGALVLLRGGRKRRPFIGRAQLFQKDVDAGDVHIDGPTETVPVRRKRRVRKVGNPSHDDHGHFTSKDKAAQPGQHQPAPQEARAALGQKLDAYRAVGGGVGSVASIPASTYAGAQVGGAIGTFVEPGLGTVAGGVIGGVAGFLTSMAVNGVSDAVGRKIAEQAFQAIHGSQAYQDAQHPTTLGHDIGGTVGSTAGGYGTRKATEALTEHVGDVLGTKGKLVAQIAGTAFSEVKGSRFGDYVAGRIGGVLDKMPPDALMSAHPSSAGGVLVQGAERAGKGARRAVSKAQFAFPNDLNDAVSTQDSPTQTRFRAMLDAADTRSTQAALPLAMRNVKRGNIQPAPGEPYAAFRARIMAALKEAAAQQPVPMRSAMSKLFDQKRSLFGKSFDSGEARDQDGKWSTGGGAPPSKAEKPKRSGSKARETTRALFQANEEAKRAGPSGSPANTAVYNRALSHIDPTELAAATRRAQREEDRNDRPVKKRDEDDLAFSMGVEIFKAIDGAVLKDGIVWGWASIIEKDGKAIIDHQGDMIDPEELVKAAHDFISNSRTGGLMHTKEANEPRKVGDIVESMVFTRELQKALDIDLGKAGWLIGFKITDPEVRKLAAGGRLPSFSIGGIGHREEMRDGE